MKTIRLEGVVGWEITAENLAPQLENESDVKIILNSGGGDIFEGFSIYNLLNNFEGNLSFCIDYAASIASIFAFASDQRIMYDNTSILMIHEAWGASAGTSTDHIKHAQELEKMGSMIANIYVENSNLNLDEVNALMKAETYFNARDALDAGFISEIGEGAANSDIVVSAMQSMKNVSFSAEKFMAKHNENKRKKAAIKESFNNCKTLAQAEKSLRECLNVSRSDGTAIVSKIKEIARGEPDAKTVVNTLKNLNFNFSGN